MAKWRTDLIAVAVVVVVMLTPFSPDILQTAEKFFDSAFMIAVIGSLAGAFAGAYGAQRTVERNKVREQILAEVRNTNATIMVAFSICGALLSVKSRRPDA
jgi:uncharacterized membrane protein